MPTMEVEMPYQTDNREALNRLFQRLRNDFGEASGESIIKAIIEECGGLRLPDMQALYPAAAIPIERGGMSRY